MTTVRAAVALVVAISVAAVSGRSTSGGSTSARPPVFGASIAPIDAELRRGMTSWRPGCPVAIRDLRLVTLTHWGFDARVHRGRLIVHRRQAGPVVRAMRVIFAAKLPIRRMGHVGA
jgi:hypothetical protein